jgi:thiamine biosynthesis lipoprotein
MRAMGSDARVIVGDAESDALEWAVAEIERLEACWSRFRSDSELTEINTHTGEWLPVSAPMLLALATATELHAATSGRFDPTILDALERAGYDRTFADVPRATEDARDFVPEAAPGFARVEIDREHARVRIPRGVRVDLGGLGKGLAADLVARGLTERGARTALVSLGGDVCARGTPPDGGWRIPVEHPLDATGVLFEFPLTAGGLVTSTTQMRAWQRNGREYHHLIDPATGDAARTEFAAVVATAPEASWAEGVAKAMVVAGAAAAPALAHATGVHAWCVDYDGHVQEVAP